MGKSYEKRAIFRGGGREKLPRNLGQINGIYEKSIATPKLLIDLFGENLGYPIWKILPCSPSLSLNQE
ncbi:hypothetical protein AFK68_12665 [Hydrocoleum sp. CS-953]|nr:hypothetical protein AFK68_12665 [Hydrocoleum sp. CS-953]